MKQLETKQFFLYIAIGGAFCLVMLSLFSIRWDFRGDFVFAGFLTYLMTLFVVWSMKYLRSQYEKFSKVNPAVLNGVVLFWIIGILFIAFLSYFSIWNLTKVDSLYWKLVSTPLIINFMCFIFVFSLDKWGNNKEDKANRYLKIKKIFLYTTIVGAVCIGILSLIFVRWNFRELLLPPLFSSYLMTLFVVWSMKYLCSQYEKFSKVNPAILNGAVWFWTVSILLIAFLSYLMIWNLTKVDSLYWKILSTIFIINFVCFIFVFSLDKWGKNKEDKANRYFKIKKIFLYTIIVGAVCIGVLSLIFVRWNFRDKFPFQISFSYLVTFLAFFAQTFLSRKYKKFSKVNVAILNSAIYFWAISILFISLLSYLLIWDLMKLENFYWKLFFTILSINFLSFSFIFSLDKWGSNHVEDKTDEK